MVTDQLLNCRAPGLYVSPVSVGPCLVVVVAGEADWSTAPDLRDQLAAALAYGPQSLVLDLTDLEFCNAAGLRALLEAADVAREAGIRVTMRGMSPQLTCLHRMFVAQRRAGGRPGRLPAVLSGSRSSSDGIRSCPSVACACDSAPLDM